MDSFRKKKRVQTWTQPAIYRILLWSALVTLNFITIAILSRRGHPAEKRRPPKKDFIFIYFFAIPSSLPFGLQPNQADGEGPYTEPKPESASVSVSVSESRPTAALATVRIRIPNLEMPNANFRAMPLNNHNLALFVAGVATTTGAVND